MSRYRTVGARPLAGGQLAPSGSVTDPELIRTLDTYRSAVAGRYLAVPPSETSSQIGGGPWWVSTKVDGELWYLCRFDDETLLVAPNGRVLSGGLEVLLLADTIPAGTIVAGELHVQRDGRRARVGDVGRALSGADSAGSLQFAVFDVVSADGLTALSPFDERWSFITEHVPEAGALHRAATSEAESTAAIGDAYSRIVSEGGAEGIVVRSSDGRTYKVKPVTDIDAVVLAFTERHSDGGGVEIRSILVGLAHPAGGWVPLCSVGNLGDTAGRRDLHSHLVGHVRPSAFRHASDGIVYQFVEPVTVVEVRVSDLQAEDSRGRLIRQPRLEFDPAAGWRAVGSSEAVGALGAVMTRVREDKLPTPRDAGWEQIEPFLTSPEPGAADESGSSEVLRRQVWVKHSGDKTDVRKLLVWKTNKEATGRYPAYVVHWTDYSSTRKSPLNREVRLAPTEEEAMRLADAMVADGVKKGWDEVG